MGQPNYTSVDRILLDMPAIGSVTNLTSEAILGAYITPAESIVDAKISRLYTTPVLPAPELLITLATDIAIYRILSRRVFNAQQLKDSVWPSRYAESLTLLDQVADGSITLVDTDGTVIEGRSEGAVATSNTKGYVHTFNEDEPIDHVQDPTKLNDIAAAREG